ENALDGTGAGGRARAPRRERASPWHRSRRPRRAPPGRRSRRCTGARGPRARPVRQCSKAAHTSPRKRSAVGRCPVDATTEVTRCRTSALAEFCTDTIDLEQRVKWGEERIKAGAV